MRTLLIFLLTLAFCPAAHADSDKKFRFLLHFFDMNETAFAYHRHCLSPDKNINDNFLGTLTFVADELLAEAAKNSPQRDPEHIKNQILERRYNIQYNLDHIQIKKGCNTPAIDEARVHYEEFSLYSKTEISHFINEETKDR